MDAGSGKVWDSNNEVMVGMKRNRAAYNARCVAGSVHPSLPPVASIFDSSVPCCIMDGCHEHHTQKSVLRNYSNFLKSGLPQRLLFRLNGEWNDYPFHVIDLIQDDFKSRKAITAVDFQGHRFLLDFVRMVHLDAATGFHKSIAWIDEYGNSFFPDSHSNFCESQVEGHSTIADEEVYARTKTNGTCEDRMKLEEQAKSAESAASEDYSDAKQIKIEDESTKNIISITKNSKIKGAFGNNFLHSVSVPYDIKFNNGQVKLSQCAEGGKAYATVQKLLLLGMNPYIAKDDIVGIFNILPASSLWKTRLKYFQNHVEMTTNLRGNANVRCAWLPSSKACAEKIMLHGVGQAKKPIYKTMYGTGIHLAPANRSNVSASCSDVDENGVIYMVLCRVILGNVEIVHPGSEQFQPSSTIYDSGLDSFKNPNHLIIWDTYVDAHILPEYIVSLRVPTNREFFPENGRTCDASEMYDCSAFASQSQKQFNAVGLGENGQLLDQHPGHEPCTSTRTVRVPISSQMPFSMLFAAVSTKVTSQDMDLINVHYDEFKRRKISRVELIKKLRGTIGDKLLISTIRHLQRKVSFIHVWLSMPFHPVSIYALQYIAPGSICAYSFNFNLELSGQACLVFSMQKFL